MKTRMAIAGLVMAASLSAGEFQLQIGAPVASRDYAAKTMGFVVRGTGCADPKTVTVKGWAEGIENGERRTVALDVRATSTPGVFGVPIGWPSTGTWIVRLAGACGRTKAGLLTDLSGRGFSRTGLKTFDHEPNDAEVEAALHDAAAR